MSCFFCNSVNHLSQFCDIHISNGSRLCKTLEKNCCIFCLADKKQNKDSSKCKQCDFNKKCYICFAKNHHTVYCLESNSSASFFLPNIDGDLISRYMKTMNDEEREFVTTLTPAVFKFCDLYPIQVGFKYKGINDKEYQKLKNSYIVATEVKISRESVLFGPNFKNMIFIAQKVSITNSTLTAKKFLQLLSSHTKEIFCLSANFTSTLTFSEVIKKVPNIVKIDFWKIDFHSVSNVTVANTWSQDLMENKRGNNFAFLRISVNDFDFDIEALATFMKTKSTSCAYFVIYIDKSTFNDAIYTQKTEELSQKLKQYFYEFKSHETGKPFLNIVAANGKKFYHCL